MAVIEKYTCDRCGRESDKELRSIRLDRGDPEGCVWVDLCPECEAEYLLLSKHLLDVKREAESAFLRGEIEWI